jgi:hypothetical protein
MEPTLNLERQRLRQLLRSRGRHAGHDIIAHTLQGLGITHVFGVDGRWSAACKRWSSDTRVCTRRSL